MSWTVYRHITPNGKSYIGITSKKPEDRWLNGRGYDLKQPFRNAIEKYGWENIQHNIISTDLTEKEAKWLENYLICYYRTFVRFSDCNGYNCTLGGDGTVGCTPWNKCKPMSEESRIKNSEAHKGKPGPNKGKTSYFKGKHHTEESRIKNSEAHKGKTSPNKGKPSPNKGKPSKNKGMHRVYHEDGTFHMER